MPSSERTPPFRTERSPFAERGNPLVLRGRDRRVEERRGGIGAGRWFLSWSVLVRLPCSSICPSTCPSTCPFRFLRARAPGLLFRLCVRFRVLTPSLSFSFSFVFPGNPFQDIDEAISITNSVQDYQGKGHSCGIYSTDQSNIMKLAEATKTSRVLVNQPQAASNSGNLWNGMRQTFSLGCGSWGNTSICHNITWRDLVNETWVSQPLAEPKVLWDDDKLFGRVYDKVGKQ